MTEEQQHLEIELANKVLSQARTTVVMNMRFMDMAIFRLKTCPDKMSLATDGEYLYFNPRHILLNYRNEQNSIARDYVHVLMHCIFRHPYVNSLVEQKIWDLSCDIAVENIILEMNIERLKCRRDFQEMQAIEALKSAVPSLTAERLYAHFRKCTPSAELFDLFSYDDHEIWYSTPSAQSDTSNRQSSGENKQGSKQTGINNSKPDNCEPDNKSQTEQSIGKENAKSKETDSKNTESEEDDTNGQNTGKDRPENEGPDSSAQGDAPIAPSSRMDWSDAKSMADRIAIEQEWRDISEHIQMDLEAFSERHGTVPGSMRQQLQNLNRERYDYTSFLKKFAVMTEAMRINDDEFDYIYYTYGLTLYKNMPLVESLEYKDVKKVREFAIAIDTSGSTSGDLVKTFLRKTYNILLSTESFDSRVKILLIQCDAAIQEIKVIHSMDQLDTYLHSMEIIGGGGTDFRPVFTYMTEQIHAGFFTNLKGLIYFTDGYGTFPRDKPPFETAFVFIRDQFNNVDVPSWAIKLILEKDEI